MGLIRELSSFIFLLPIISSASTVERQESTNCPGPTMSIGNTSTVYDRAVHMVYARNSGKALNEPDQEVLAAIDLVSPQNITALIPFLLNVENVTSYKPIITKLQNRGIVIVPGFGGDPTKDPPINDSYYKSMACSARKYSDYIRIENAQGYYNWTNSADDLQDMINYLKSIGFKHIMLNTWPRDDNFAIVPFTDTELDATLFQVLLSTVNDTQGGLPDDNNNNWYPGNLQKLQQMREYSQATFDDPKHVQILINYESAPQHQSLAGMEAQSPLSSEAAMQTTLTRMSKPAYRVFAPLHWLPPYTSEYDPVALGTWAWIVSQLKSM